MGDRHLLCDTEGVSSQNAVQKVLSAAMFAAEKHSAQRRKGAAAEPYLNHLIEVAELVSAANEEPDTDLVIAALLHDSIEDAMPAHRIGKALEVQALGG